ncbi:hypothetical protein ABW20_dc0101045 [Dactylellina cionopaga]|nr:hypothetical protein ABW20_dc0101045 [Dactylellina cionopaga]
MSKLKKRVKGGKKGAKQAKQDDIDVAFDKHIGTPLEDYSDDEAMRHPLRHRQRRHLIALEWKPIRRRQADGWYEWAVDNQGYQIVCCCRWLEVLVGHRQVLRLFYSFFGDHAAKFPQRRRWPPIGVWVGTATSHGSTITSTATGYILSNAPTRNWVPNPTVNPDFTVIATTRGSPNLEL